MATVTWTLVPLGTPLPAGGRVSQTIQSPPSSASSRSASLLHLRTEAKRLELGDRILLGRADQIGHLHEDLARHSQGIPRRSGSTGTGADVDQVRADPEGNHRAELTPGNTGALAQDEHSRPPRVNVPANLDAPVAYHGGVDR